MQSKGEAMVSKEFMFWSYYAATESMPYFKDHSNQKNSTEISRLSLSDLPLDRYQRVFI